MKILFSILILVLTTVPAQARKARCADFATQAQAQAYMYSNGAYHLDRDKDGEACECLQGGSKHGSSKCHKSSKRRNQDYTNYFYEYENRSNYKQNRNRRNSSRTR